MPSSTPLRDRARYLALALGTIIVGLAVHLRGHALAPALRDWLGDALWASMLTWGVSALAPAWPRRARAAAALAGCTAVELSQLLRLPALDAIRRTTLGHLVLGSDFDARDLGAYAVGVLAAALLDRLMRGRADVARGATAPHDDGVSRLLLLLLLPALLATSCGRGRGLALVPAPVAADSVLRAVPDIALRLATQHGLTARRDSVVGDERWDTCAAHPRWSLSLCWRTRPGAVEFRVLEWKRGGRWAGGDSLSAALGDSLRARFGADAVRPCAWRTRVDRERSTIWTRRTRTVCEPRGGAAKPAG